MNKYLMLSAVALFATSASAIAKSAGSGSVHLIGHSSGGNSFCDTFTITWSGNEYAYIDNFSPCGVSSVIYGMGISSKTKGIGKNVVFPNFYQGDINAGYYDGLQFGLPLKSGNALNGYYTTGGQTVTQYLAGYYTIGTTPKHPSRISTADAFRKHVQK